MTKVKCLKCGSDGILLVKQTVSKGIKYQYWYVKHTVDRKIKWCYIGKTLPEEYQKLTPRNGSTQTGTQRTTDPNKLKSSFPHQNSFKNECLGSLARWGFALVRRGSRVQIPPEASTVLSKKPSARKSEPFGPSFVRAISCT